MTRSRGGAALALLLLAVLVNLPLAHSAWVERRVQTSGTDVTAVVVGHEVVGGDEHWLSFTFPEEVDPDRRTWTAEVDPGTYDAAVASGEVSVRVLPDRPSEYTVDGAVTSRVPLVLTLVADLLLVLAAVFVVRRGGRGRPPLQALALEDVRRGPPGVALDRIVAEDYLVRGEVLERDDGEVVLDLGNRTVRVLLDGHANPVGHQQQAEVRARLIG